MTAEIDLDALEATAKAATPGPWEVDLNTPFSNEIVGIFAPEAKRYAMIAESRPTGSGPINKRANAAYMAAASPDVVLALIERLRAAENAAIPGGCIYCSSSGVYEDFDGVNQPCSACDGTGTPRVGTIYRELIDSLSHVDEATDPILLATRVIACLKGDPNWESLEAPK